MRIVLTATFAVLSLAIVFVARAPAESSQATTTSVEGPIVKITSDDITIKSVDHKAHWFRLGTSPRIFFADGKTPYRREALHPGQRVRIFYDWQLLTYVVVAHHVIVLTR